MVSFCFYQAKFPPITKRRSDDDARVSRDAYDMKIGLFWVELAKTKPTGESGVKNHARGSLPRTKRPTFRPQTREERGTIAAVSRRAAAVVPHHHKGEEAEEGEGSARSSCPDRTVRRLS